jgi:restriction system protein
VKINRLVDTIRNKTDLLYLRTKDFEYVVAEIYKRKEYRVRMSDHFGEGGTGIVLNELCYVQVWKSACHHLMEVEQAKKLARHMQNNGIYRGIIITLGDFKSSTRNYCHTNVISCIDGNCLLQMCKEVQVMETNSIFSRIFS